MTWRPVQALRAHSLPLFLLLLAVLVIGLALTYLRRAETRPRLSLRIATAAVPFNAALVQARLDGSFAAAGLDVTWIHCESGRQALAELAAGRCDIAAAADAAVALEITRGASVRLLSSLASCVDQTSVIVRRDRGIADPVDLAGRRLALLLGSSADYMLDTLLELRGVPVNAVQRIDAPPGEWARMLRAGEVDGVVAWPPQADRIGKDLGGLVQHFNSGGIYRWNWLLVSASGPRPPGMEEAERRLLRVLVDASTAIRQEPERAAQRLATQLGSTPADLLEAWKDIHLATRLDQSLLMSLESQARWAMAKGYAPPGAVPNLLRIIDPVPLSSVAPGNVSLIHPAVDP